MDDRHEAEALRAVQQRLNDEFSLLGEEVVEAAIRLAHSRLGGPIRDFVPVLVERIARERLVELRDHPSPSTPATPAPAAQPARSVQLA